MKSSNKNLNSLLSVGHVKAAHGIRGEIFAHIPSGEWDWAALDQEIQLQSKEAPAPLKTLTIEKFRAHKTGLIIKFKEVTDRNQAEALRGHLLLIEKNHFVSKPGEKVYLQEVLGFRVYDKETEVGEVHGFMDNGAQDLLRVKDKNHKEKEHLIPFIEVFIDSIDFEDKAIHMNLPEGLLE